ncbi:hypothetical protein KC878_02465 [Candidatus Saccharibacteria bacterium]|nr:hypothetical protein [Candidatus Saccharibacteria bacterium]MCB9821363.1 hypothetical protein [Candidatus Nomurabacteria bacterium]
MDEATIITLVLFLLALAFISGYGAGLVLSETPNKRPNKYVHALYAMTVGFATAAFAIRFDYKNLEIGSYLLLVLGFGLISVWSIKVVAFGTNAFKGWGLIWQFGYFVVGLPALMVALA